MIISISLLAPSPRIQEGARGGVGGAREPRLHVSRRLPACVRVVVFSHTPRSSWNGEVEEGIPTHPPSSSSSGENVDSDFRSLFVFFLHFFFARMERMKGREYRSYESFISDAAFHPPSHTTTFAEPTLPLRLPRALRPGLFRVRKGMKNNVFV